MQNDLKELLRYLMDEEDAGGYTPLHHAASEGNKKIVRSLLKYGAMSRPELGWCRKTPLQEAVLSYDNSRDSHVEIIRKKAEENYPDIIRMLEEAEGLEGT